MTVVPAPLPAPGASGNVLTSDGSWWASAAAAGGGGGGQGQIGVVSGLRYGPVSNGTSATVTVSAGFVFGVPWAVSASLAFAGIEVSVLTSGAVTGYLGVYSATAATGRPNALLASGAIDPSTTGVKTVTFGSALTLTAGLYFMAIRSASAVTSFGVEGRSTGAQSLWLPITVNSANTHGAVFAADAGTTLPSTFPTPSLATTTPKLALVG